MVHATTSIRGHPFPPLYALALLVLAMVGVPATLAAQPGGGTVPRVGHISGASDSRREEAFRTGLRELGYVNLKTAKALRLPISPSLLGRADQLIQ